MKHLFFIVIVLFCSKNTNAQISLLSLNDFEDGTTMGWGVGPVATNPPVNITTGGPNGVNDNFLRSTSVGGSGASGRLIIYNSSSVWTGNWTTAGVKYISFKANNSGSTDLTLRVSLDGAGGRFSTTNGVSVPAGSGWINVNIAVDPSDFTSVGGTNINNTLSNVTVIRILDNPIPSFLGDIIVATLDLDLISTGSAPLPVTLEYFTVTAAKTKNIIHWKTLTESNSNYFEIERSVNGTDWEILERTPAAGHSMSPLVYTIQDFFPHKGISFYRLKQVDMDGRYIYSLIRSIVFDGSAIKDLIISPNPGIGLFTLVLPQQQNNKPVVIEICDNRGIRIYTTTLQKININTPVTKLDLTKQPKGLYFIKVKSGDKVWTDKLMIQ